MTAPQTTAGTAGEGYRSPAPHVCVTGPYEFGRRPCCTPVRAPRARPVSEGVKAS